VLRLQHHPVAAEGDDRGGLLRRRIAVARGEAGAGVRRGVGGGGEEGDAAGEALRPEGREARGGGEGQGAVHTSLRCSSTGMPWRTRAVRAGSMRAVAQPMPSEARATTWPQGSQISEWP
jgi:hypothetical protein